MATLALISFTHSDPLCRAISGIDTVRATPSAILDGVIEGRYDYGMVSLLGYIRNMDRLSLIDSGTIHSNGKILSTILVSTQLSIKRGSQVSVTA
ncbi:MAG: ABC transporter substrate-binding protein, partial [Candidatus Thermoplasmatota archaeon]|nr:ABC transporter substrate-binding protein [Candidatus Thermoplasmatota archaeon]